MGSILNKNYSFHFEALSDNNLKASKNGDSSLKQDFS
jgi:hypothetical protein